MVYGAWTTPGTLAPLSSKRATWAKRNGGPSVACKDGGLVEASLEARHLQALVSGSGRRVPTSQSHTSERRYGGH